MFDKPTGVPAAILSQAECGAGLSAPGVINHHPEGAKVQSWPSAEKAPHQGNFLLYIWLVVCRKAKKGMTAQALGLPSAAAQYDRGATPPGLVRGVFFWYTVFYLKKKEAKAMKAIKQLKKGDFAAFALILLLAGGIWGLGLSRGTGDLTAEVRQNGVLVRRIALTGLNEPVTFTLTGEYENTILAENGRVCIKSATCPHQDCVHTGWLTRAGQSAVCLEKRVSVTVVSQGEAEDPDAIVR